MPVSKQEFKKTVTQFAKIEARSGFWARARKLLMAGYEPEAYIFLLATWNFAGFRYLLNDFNANKFEAAVKKLNSVFGRVKAQTLESADFENQALGQDIKLIYRKLKALVKQTGASKLMALKNPTLFVMWETKIRKMYRINNQADPDDYLRFFKRMKQDFAHIKWTDAMAPLAKTIDEYNYIKAGSATGF
jgi:hypothetical protein